MTFGSFMEKVREFLEGTTAVKWLLERRQPLPLNWADGPSPERIAHATRQPRELMTPIPTPFTEALPGAGHPRQAGCQKPRSPMARQARQFDARGVDKVCQQIEREEAAARTLERLGWTWRGGPEWAPPVGAPSAYAAGLDPIPAYVYFSREHGNFYDAHTLSGKSESFYHRWVHRRYEFPKTPEEAKARKFRY